MSVGMSGEYLKSVWDFQDRINFYGSRDPRCLLGELLQIVA